MLFPIILETNRLRLRCFRPEELKILFTSFSKEDIMRVFDHRTEDEYQLEKERYEAGITCYQRSMLIFQLQRKEDGKILGWCGYHTWYLRHYRAEAFYFLKDDEDKRKGYMQEAFKCVIEYGWDQMGLRRIEALTATDNDASIQLLLKNGFQREGLVRKHYCDHDENTDSILFGLLKEEWRNT